MLDVKVSFILLRVCIYIYSSGQNYVATHTRQNSRYVACRQVDGRQVDFVDVLACERARFDVVGEVAPVAMQEGDRAGQAVSERWQLDRS